MNFAQYLAGGGAQAPDGAIEDGSLVCFEDGTCVPGQGREVGRRFSPSGVQGPANPHRTYGDGTGGHFYYGGDNSVVPQAIERESDPSAGLSFLALLDLIRRERGGQRPGDRRSRGDR